MNNDGGAWIDRPSLQELREMLTLAQSVFDPEDLAADVRGRFEPRPDTVDPELDAMVSKWAYAFDRGPAVQWADTVDPGSGAYRQDALALLADPMAESIICVIRDSFVCEPRAERVAAIIHELGIDRDRLTRILTAIERRHGNAAVPEFKQTRAAALAKVRGSMPATLRAAAEGKIALTPQLLRAIAEVIEALLHELGA